MGAINSLKASVFLVAILFSACERSEKREAVLPVEEEKKNIPEFNEEASGFSGENAYNRVSYFVSLGERQVASEGLEKSIQFMEKELSRFGWKTERQTFSEETVAGHKTFTNLRARLGSEADFKTSATGVIGCHIDTKVMPFLFVAANDGASHAAVLLEFARLMGREKERWAGVELVFFDGEECFGEFIDTESDGLYGSRYYVGNTEMRNLQWMVNLDMLGARKLKISIPLETDQNLFLLYRKTILELGESDNVFGVAPSTILDDHFPFCEKGVPTINFIADFNDGGWWHTPKDNLDLISATSLQRSGRFIWNYLNKLVPKEEK